MSARCFTDDETVNGFKGFDFISEAAIARYDQNYVSILENEGSGLIVPFSYEIKDHNRLKRSPNEAESIGCNFGLYSSRRSYKNDGKRSIGGFSSKLPKLNFRDHIWSFRQRYLEAEAFEEAAAAATANGDGTENENGNADGMKLVQLLISCAEAVACHDKLRASALLAELRSYALVFGSSFQRVASCFVQGLNDRLSWIQPLGAVGFTAPNMNVKDFAPDKKEEAFNFVYDICPHIRFAHYIANACIIEALEGESFIHVVDLGMTLALPHGHQWRRLIHSLADRAGKPPCLLRITAVGLNIERFEVIGDELDKYTKELGINFKFSVVQTNLENLRPEDIKTYENEVIVFNSILQLHYAVKESRGALKSVLQTIHKLSPKLLVLIEQDSSHNGPFFLGRFMEALHYYSAIFDSLDAMLPKYDTRRAKIEQYYFAEEIKNIVSCEGPARVERHERVDQWRRRLSCAGFQAAHIKMVPQARQWLGKNTVCEGYTVLEEKGCLVLGWKSKPIISVSCWKARHYLI